MTNPKSPTEMASLFIDNTGAPNVETGIMDIGKNCAQCLRLDFLPFVCEHCKSTFCEDHRRLDAHGCKYKHKQRDQRSEGGCIYLGPTAKSLFPDAEKRKRSQELRFEQNKLPYATSIAEALSKKALSKFAKFLNILANSNRGKIITTTSLLTASNLSLKRDAKGDGKICPADRVYVWTLIVDGDLEKINIEKQRKPMFLNKKWPIGRALDVIADIHRVSNNNNTIATSEDRLNIFKLNAGKPALLKLLERCLALVCGDTLFLVRGSLD